MFAIFCIPEATYVKLLNKYVIEDRYDPDTNSINPRRHLSRRGRGFTMVPLRTTIYDNKPNITYTLDSWNNSIWVREPAFFDSFQELTHFCNTWFSNGYFSATHAKEFQPDNPTEGVANPTMDYPNECFEIHEIIDNRIVSTASLCVCIPTKVSK